MSTFISQPVSNHTGINYVGSHMNPNANVSYMWKTFDRADCDAMYTKQAIKMAQALGDTNKPHTPLENVTIYLSACFASTQWKVKSNVTCARRYGELQPMRPDVPRATILQWSNKEWLARVPLSWINIRGQTEPVYTQLLTFIEMHWMVECSECCILRWDSTKCFFHHWIEKEENPHHESHSLYCTDLRENWVNSSTENQAALKHPWYFFHVLCMYMFNLIAETD